MFAFALWDSIRYRLLLARDRLGIKPLYYAETRGSLIFGSEIKAILQHPDVASTLDSEALGNFLSLKYVPCPQTMFSGIRVLPPGHLLICERAGTFVRRYWRLSYARKSTHGRTEQDWTEELEHLLRESVQMHLVSDVPFGAFLSGGLDSSTVVALMSQALTQSVKTFAVGFDGEGSVHSELPYARLVAQRWHTDHHELLVGAKDFIAQAEEIIWHLDQPIADPAALPNYMVARLARREVKMVLTGEGGDELFAGYARYAGERFSSLLRWLPPTVKQSLLASAERMPGLRAPKLALRAMLQSDEATRLAEWFPLFNRDMKAKLLSDDFARELNGSGPADVFARELAETDATGFLNRMLYLDTKLWLADDLLARGDKTSMAASLEARVPLLDHKLVEFAAGLPPALKLNGFTRKYLLRKVGRQLLPPKILSRRKKGFPVPLSIWFRKEARGFVRDLLSPATVRRRGFFRSGSVELLLKEHESGFADHGNQIWSLVSIELWLRLYLDSSCKAQTLSPSETASISAARP
jgi:asparagine synthase (glutamine-hydrolysing)